MSTETNIPNVGDPIAIIKDGKVVQRSRNLRGLTTRAFKVGISSASVLRQNGREGLAYVKFCDGSWCRVMFADFAICRDFFRWRWKKWGLYAEVRNSDNHWAFI